MKLIERAVAHHFPSDDFYVEESYFKYFGILGIYRAATEFAVSGKIGSGGEYYIDIFNKKVFSGKLKERVR